LLKAFLGAAAFFGVGIRQLERAGLGCQAKNQPCFSGSVGRGSACSSAEQISFGNTHDPNESGVFKPWAEKPV